VFFVAVGVFVLMFAGLLLVVAGATFAVRHSKAAGEPFLQARTLHARSGDGIGI
jgi:hypothetical protein